MTVHQSAFFHALANCSGGLFGLLFVLSGCASSKQTVENFFPLDGQWSLKKISCLQSPIEPENVAQLNARLLQKKFHYLLTVQGRSMHIQERLYPDVKAEGFCESEIDIQLKELPSSALIIDTITIVQQRAMGTSDENCPKRNDLNPQRDSQFELRGSELKIFQYDGIDARNLCSGTSPMLSTFGRIF